MENRDLAPMDKYSFYNKRTQEREFVSPEAEVEWNKECLDDVVDGRKTYDLLGIGGKVGVTYLGLRAFGKLCGFGPELDPDVLNVTGIADAIGFASTYVGGMCWLAAKLLQYTDERSARKDYKKAVSKLKQNIA